MPTPEELMLTESQRRDAILALGEQYAKYVAQKDIADALRNGKSVDQFRELIMQKMETAHTDTRQLQIGMTGKEIRSRPADPCLG